MKARPNYHRVLVALVRDIALRMPEFSHIKASRILIVAGEARRASRGTIKPLTFSGRKLRHSSGRRKPDVRIGGKRMLYCITLRPLFFRDSTVETRVATLLHELFHISPKFDGTLAENRRHARLGNDFSVRLRPLVRRYLALVPPELMKPLGYDGEVRMLHWLERPPALDSKKRSRLRRKYTEEQLFLGPLRVMTKVH